MKLWVFLIIFILVLILGLVIFKLVSDEPLKYVTINDSSKVTVSSCNLLTNSSQKEECYLSVVRDNKDSSICRLISDVRLRGDCYLIAEGK